MPSCRVGYLKNTIMAVLILAVTFSVFVSSHTVHAATRPSGLDQTSLCPTKQSLNCTTKLLATSQLRLPAYVVGGGGGDSMNFTTTLYGIYYEGVDLVGIFAICSTTTSPAATQLGIYCVLEENEAQVWNSGWKDAINTAQYAVESPGYDIGDPGTTWGAGMAGFGDFSERLYNNLCKWQNPLTREFRRRTPCRFDVN